MNSRSLLSLQANLTRCRYSDTTQRLLTQHTQVLFNARQPVQCWPSVKTMRTTTRLHVTVAYRVYTHAHNTLTVAQLC